MMAVKWLTCEEDDNDDVVQKLLHAGIFSCSIAILLLKGCDMKNIEE